MTKIETKLKQQGWKIEIFQPKGEPYPWSIKIIKKVTTKGLHSDSVNDWVRQCKGNYVITAYLNPTGKLSEKEKEERIVSSIKWELTKQYKYLSKYDYLNKLTEIVGEVHPLIFKKRVKRAYTENANEKALESKKEQSGIQLTLTDSKQEPVEKKVSKKSSAKQAETIAVKKTTVQKKVVQKAAKSKKSVKQPAKKATASKTEKKASLPKKKTSDKNKQAKQAKTVTKKVSNTKTVTKSATKKNIKSTKTVRKKSAK